MTTPGGDLETKYRATKLWNEIIRSFRRKMPVSRHRRQLKFYEDTFTGAEALAWLHNFLSSREEYAESQISKDQAYALLNKFLLQGAFTSVKPSSCQKVKVDQTLYKFTDISPSKLGRTPLAVKIHRHASMKAVENSSASPKLVSKFKGPVTPLRFRKLASPAVTKLEKRISPAPAESSHAKQSIILKSAQSLLDERKMKCCTRSPMKRKGDSVEEENRGSPILRRRDHDYEHIEDLGEGSAPDQGSTSSTTDLSQMQLMSRTLSQDEIDHIWKTAAIGKLQASLNLLDTECLLSEISIEGGDVRWNALHLSRSGITVVKQPQDGLPSWVLRAMRCLTRWPFDNAGQFGFQHTYSGFERDVFAQVIDFLKQHCQPLLRPEFVRVLLKILQLSRGRGGEMEFVQSAPLESSSEHCLANALTDIQTMSPNGEKLLQHVQNYNPSGPLPHQPHYETEFGKVDPVTRILLPKQTVNNNYSIYANAEALKRGEARASMRRPSFSRMSRLRSSLNAGALSDRKCKEWSKLTLEPPIYPSTQPMSVALRRSLAVAGDKLHEVEAALDSLPGLVQSPELLRKVREARQYLDLRNQYALTNTSSLESALSGCRGSLAVDNRRWYEQENEASQINRAEVSASITNCEVSASFSDISMLIQPQTMKSRVSPQCMRALSISLLFLPAKTRHWLHFTIRFMAKVAANKCLKLDAHGGMSNKQKVLKSLLPAIVGESNETDCSYLIELLIDCEENIFRAPEVLCSTVKESIERAQRQRIQLVEGGLSSVNFCDRISEREYGMQKLSTSQMALTQLLDTIVTDDSMPSKSKKARLKQFESEYPSIFQRRFPSTDSVKALFPEKPKRRGVHVSNPLNKLKALRL